jgi:hypothetical protein
MLCLNEGLTQHVVREVYSADGLNAPAPTSSVLVWATDPGLVEALSVALSEPGRQVRLLHQDAQLVEAHTRGSVLVAEYGQRLAVQQSFLKGAFVLVDPRREAPATLTARAYAVVRSAPEAGLAVDRFFEHRRLAQQAAARRAAPSRCARCGRGFDSVKANGSPARRFVRFGSLALCGGCVEALRKLLRQAESAVVEADA